MYSSLKNFSGRLAVEDDTGAVVKPPFGFGYLDFSDRVKVDARLKSGTNRAGAESAASCLSDWVGSVFISVNLG